MVFTKDVRQMTDDELSAAVRSTIEAREPESVDLDYKQALNIDKEPGRKELAKDISSFANEQGGAVLYGVPETDKDDLPRPKPLAECGIDVDGGLPERVENILLSTVEPPLHGLTIKLVDIEEIRPKQLLLVYHPESYWKPHMVQGYGDGRYYRRGNFRAVQMTERQVEVAYAAREAARTHAKVFFESASFGPPFFKQIQVVACPVFPGRLKDRMLQPAFRDWLYRNKPVGPTHPREGEWLPFLDGWRFLAHPQGSVSGKQYEIRVFHNGAVCLTLDARAHCLEGGTLLLERVERDLRNLFVGYCATAYGELSLNGPVVVRFSLWDARGLKTAADTDEHRKVRAIQQQIAERGVAADGRKMYRHAPVEPGLAYTDGDDLVFDEESSVDEIIEQAESITSRLVARIGTAFGLWGLEDDEA